MIFDGDRKPDPNRVLAVWIAMLFLAAILLPLLFGETPTFNGIAILIGALTTIFTVCFSINQGQVSARTQFTLQALQALRNDREYIAAAMRITRHIQIGRPIDEATVERLEAARRTPDPDEPYDPANPPLHHAVSFVLNQYEFMAAAVWLREMDKTLLEQTVRGVVIGLVRTFAPLIAFRRQTTPETWQNLVWLYDAFTEGMAAHERPELGPPPHGPARRAGAAPWYAYASARDRRAARADAA